MTDAKVTVHQAVELLVGQLQPSGSELRATKDRVRKRIVYALVKGKLRHAGEGQEGLDKNDLLVWARGKWPGQIKLKTTQFVDVEDTVNFSDKISGDSYPANLDECHRLLRDARRKLMGKDLQCVMLMGEVARYRADAEKFRQICEKNQLSAGLPRKGGL